MVMCHWHWYRINISPSLCCLCWCVHFQKRQLTAPAALVCSWRAQPLQLAGESWAPQNLLTPHGYSCSCLGKAGAGGSGLYKPRQAWLPSQNCCALSSGLLHLWMCMHALRPINEKKVITVCGRGKLQGQRMPTARGPAQNCKVCAENKMGIQALHCNLPKRHSEGTTLLV